MTLDDQPDLPIRTAKQLAFVKRRLDAPKEPLADSVIAAGYNVKSRHNASLIGSSLKTKPAVIMALAKYSDLAESVIVGTMRDWKDAEKPRQREIALNAAMFAHDKVHGKATTRIETQSSVVRININLTGDGQDFTEAELLEDPDT